MMKQYIIFKSYKIVKRHWFLLTAVQIAVMFAVAYADDVSNVVTLSETVVIWPACAIVPSAPIAPSPTPRID